MYYYGYNNGYGTNYQTPNCNNGFVGYTQGGFGFGAALFRLSARGCGRLTCSCFRS